jgi:micrococcal nuclease
MFEYNAKVKKIVDGDTADFQVDLGFNVYITIRGRFKGVDTPERGHEDWHKATSKCRNLLRCSADIKFENEPDEEWWVVIKTEKTGKYGRWLVEIDGVTDELAKIWPYEQKGAK